MKTEIISIHEPSVEEVEKYLIKWEKRDDGKYRYQEVAVNCLFDKFPLSTDLNSVLIKCSCLNDFYSTNIWGTFQVAKHIITVNDIDSRLKIGDLSVVNDISHVEIKGKTRVLYSFASKYCSHHNEDKFPIWDRYVNCVLKYFRNSDHFLKFIDSDLHDYITFYSIIIEFREYYHLNQFSLKQIDRYLWQVGKDYFNKYSEK